MRGGGVEGNSEANGKNQRDGKGPSTYLFVFFIFVFFPLLGGEQLFLDGGDVGGRGGGGAVGAGGRGRRGRGRCHGGRGRGGRGRSQGGASSSSRAAAAAAVTLEEHLALALQLQRERRVVRGRSGLGNEWRLGKVLMQDEIMPDVTMRALGWPAAG